MAQHDLYHKERRNLYYLRYATNYSKQDPLGTPVFEYAGRTFPGALSKANELFRTGQCSGIAILKEVGSVHE